MAVLVVALVVVVVMGALRLPAREPAGSAADGIAAATSSPTGTVTASIGSVPSSTPTTYPTATPAATPSRAAPTNSPKPVACKPTDQDRYVYNPDRLAVQAACIRVAGTAEAVRTEADGDLHILLALDPAFTHLLTPANQGVELGDLVVEPVCVRPVTQADAIAICASDPDPLSGPIPVVGQKIWMEGRYVFDLEHDGWAELHPLYRWSYR